MSRPIGRPAAKSSVGTMSDDVRAARGFSRCAASGPVTSTKPSSAPGSLARDGVVDERERRSPAARGGATA